MSYIAREARQELLETVAGAAEEIGAALALVEVAYERLDESSADRLEEQLFRPVQRAYGRAQRTHSGFAERHGLEARPLSPHQPSHAAAQPRELVEDAAGIRSCGPGWPRCARRSPPCRSTPTRSCARWAARPSCGT